MLDEPLQEIPTNEHEELVPPFESQTRKLSVVDGILVLLASMVGGGMLTLPLATSKVGLWGSLFLALVCALLNETTYFMLILSARDTTSSSFHEVAQKTLGPQGRLLSILCMVGLTLMASMSYLLLLGSLLGDLLLNKHQSRGNRNGLVLGFTCLVLFPLSLSRSLDVLKLTNLLSALAALLLLLAIGLELETEGMAQEKTKLVPDSLGDVAFALPFFLSAFLAHFSLLAMHRELARPSLGRVRLVTRGAVLAALVLFSCVGLSGYLLVKTKTCDSILSNLPPTKVATCARVGLVAMLSLSFPLFVLPSREALAGLCGVGEQTATIRFGLTLGFCALAVFLACVVPSIAVAFSLTGSTLGIMVGLVLPSLFTLGNSKSSTGWKGVAWIILVVSVGAMAACSWSTFIHRNDVSACDQ